MLGLEESGMAVVKILLLGVSVNSHPPRKKIFKRTRQSSPYSQI